MSEHKLVPVEPTPEMVSAAADAYMPFGDMEMAIRMALLAAPDHIADAGKMVSRQQIREVFLRNGFTIKPGCDDLREYVYKAAFELLELTAPAVQGEPHPAAHQPCPEGIREGAPYDDPAFQYLCREHEVLGTAAAAQCAVFWEAGKRVAEQQSAPDVAGLVEALARCRHEASYSIGEEEALSIQLGKVRDIVNQTLSALAPYRKGGDAL